MSVVSGLPISHRGANLKVQDVMSSISSLRDVWTTSDTQGVFLILTPLVTILNPLMCVSETRGEMVLTIEYISIQEKTLMKE